MNVLWVATKPPWPPIDGGRLLQLSTIESLRAAGHQLTLVAPITAEADSVDHTSAHLRPLCHPYLVPARPRPLVVDGLNAQLRGTPMTLVRHRQHAVRQRVDQLLHGEDFDLVHVEQLQALSSAEGARRKGLPIVLRAQNVESDIWRGAAESAFWRKPLFSLEARRLAAWEGDAVRRCDATIALTPEDASRLAALSGCPERIHHVAAPFEAELPLSPRTLSGSPAVVVFGSGGWLPNTGGAAWFLSEIWPSVRTALPHAILHIFGFKVSRRVPGIEHHPSPEESREAFAQNSVLCVPLKVASGVRIKILEAWARGVPVVATPEAARGLGAEDDQHLLLARDADELTAALSRFPSQDLTNRLVAEGRRKLRQEHAPHRIAEQLEAIYRTLV